MTDFNRDLYAKGSADVRKSRIATMETIAADVGVTLFPLQEESLVPVLAVLKAAGYRSVDQMLSALHTTHVERGFTTSEHLERFLQRAKASVTRNLGPTKRAGHFDPLEIATLPREQDSIEDAPVHLFSAVGVGFWWLLREIEASALVMKQAAILLDGITGDQVAQISLGATKTDTVGKGVFRRHACVCAAHEGRFSFICPREILRDHLRERELEGAADDDPLFPTRKGGHASKAGWAAALQTFLTPLDEFGLTGHSLRRSGAKFLARLGMARWKIQFLARWGTSVVDLYVEEAYAEAAATHSLDSLAETGGSGLQLRDIQCAVAEFLQASGSSGKAMVSGESAAVTELSKLVSGLDAKWAVLSEKVNVELFKQVCSELDDTPNVVEAIEDSVLTFERIRCTSSDKVHVIETAEPDVHHAEWTTLCGWRFAAAKNSVLNYVRGAEQPKQDKDRCVNCHNALVELGEGEVLQIRGVTTAAT
jgi:hypothetical protein